MSAKRLALCVSLWVVPPCSPPIQKAVRIYCGQYVGSINIPYSESSWNFLWTVCVCVSDPISRGGTSPRGLLHLVFKTSSMTLRLGIGRSVTDSLHLLGIDHPWLLVDSPGGLQVTSCAHGNIADALSALMYIYIPLCVCLPSKSSCLSESMAGFSPGKQSLEMTQWQHIIDGVVKCNTTVTCWHG